MLEPGSLLLLSSVVWGLAWASGAWLLVCFLTEPVAPKTRLSAFEEPRRKKLREASWVYRYFEAGIDKLTRFNARRKGDKLDKLRRNLVVAAEPLPITAEEYLAFKQLESFLAALAGLAFGWYMANSVYAGLALGAIVAFIYQLLMSNQVASRAQKRLHELKKRLPFCIDLMALMMEAGATFPETMATAIRENPGNPIAQEFGMVQRDIALGRTRNEALLAMQTRLNDDDMTEIIFAVNKGEELGTPLSQILRTQAEQMRLKRSQWLEKASAEAQVSIVFPGILIMMACLLIVVSPFVLGAFYTPQ